MFTRTRPARKAKHPLLVAVRDRRDSKREADLALVVSVVDWAAAHTDTDPFEAPEDVLGPTALALAGPGAPRVEDFALYELAATLGRTIESASLWVGDILEVRYRLPLCWARVASGDLAPWRAFEIAQQTKALNRLGADYVDRHLAPVASTVSMAQLARTVRHALIAFDRGRVSGPDHWWSSSERGRRRRSRPSVSRPGEVRRTGGDDSSSTPYVGSSPSSPTSAPRPPSTYAAPWRWVTSPAASLPWTSPPTEPTRTRRLAAG